MEMAAAMAATMTNRELVGHDPALKHKQEQYCPFLRKFSYSNGGLAMM